MNCPHCKKPDEQIVICNGCACMNNDMTDGSSCNLGYNSRYGMFLSYDKFCDQEWYTWSDVCRLESVKTLDGHMEEKTFYIPK